MKVRTRFAPSPTGKMHVGNLRTALYAYLTAKHEGGDFLLRIEDTDRERYDDEALSIIYSTMEKAGLKGDEGPGIGGDYGPYVQSERVEAGIYMKYALELVEKKEAYYCFCDEERLATLREDTGDKTFSAYDKHCLSLSEEEVQEKLSAGVPYVIRQNIPREGTTSFVDEIYGEITVENAELDDMILIKSDGYPTYNFANVVDDHLMGITHILRGNEYLSSTPKYNRLYMAFGWEIPKYIHCPLITNEDHEKLSKRSGHSSFEDLLEQGFLPETIVNFVALLGWAPKDNREVMSLSELIEAFDYRSINKSPAVFDMNKLRWMNGEYVHAMDFSQFYEMAAPIIDEHVHIDTDKRKIAGMVQSRIETVFDIPEHIDFFDRVPEYDSEMYVHKKMKTTKESSLSLLKEILPVLMETEDYSNDGLYSLLSEFAASHEYKNGYVLWPIRTAVSGKQMTPGGATELMELLGKDLVIERIKSAINKLEA